jgi:hypothetical protein
MKGRCGVADIVAFNDQVAARGDAAGYVLDRPALLVEYQSGGGLPEDLEFVQVRRWEAEAANQRQGVAGSVAAAATAEALRQFGALQEEYSRVMAVVQAVREDLAAAGAPGDLLLRLDGIMANEAQVRVVTSVAPEGKRRVRRKVSHEAIRAEVARDARSLMDLTGVHAALGRRRVDLARLRALLDDAVALSGKLATPAEKRGARKAITVEERAAVAALNRRWGACYRLLRPLAARDAGLAELLKKAARKR